jgi:hypothetical protein
MPLVEPARAITMGFCLECHRHPEPNLRPKSEITNMVWTPEGDPEALGRELVRAYDVHPRTNCTTCHR